MTSLTTYTPRKLSPIEELLATVGPLNELINMLWWTDAVPMSYKRDRGGQFTEAKTKALMLASALLGNAMGVDPFRSWANIHPTGQGRLSIASGFKMALAQAAGHEIEILERNIEQCTGRARRKGSEEWIELTLTMGDAVRAGWTKNPLYDTVGGDMLYRRLSARLADMVAADVTMGIVTWEDYKDLPDEQEQPALESRPVTVRHIEAPRPRRPVEDRELPDPATVLRGHRGIVGRLVEEQEEPEPATTVEELAEEPDAAGADVFEEELARQHPEEAVITANTWAAINNLFRNAHRVNGTGQTEARKRVITAWIEREIEGRFVDELTEAEGQLIRDKLFSWTPEQVRTLAYPNYEDQAE